MADDPSQPKGQFMPEENLQAIIRKWMNREVVDYFRDYIIAGSWDPDLTTSRGQLARALYHSDADPYLITFLKMWFFEHVKSQTYRVPYYGIPVSSFQESRKFQPQINLCFVEDLADVDENYAPVTGEISFRIMGPENTSITPAQAQVFANRIKLVFGVGGAGYIWRKGKDMATYTDWAKGYQLQLLTRSRTEAREVISKVLDIQNDTPDWKKMNYSENEEPMEAFPTIPDVDTVYGLSRRRPRRRPIADCRFQVAFLHIHGMPNPVTLYDRSGVHPTALETN